jgi:hypothetical protein
MFQGRKVVSVTPAGRKKYLEILVPYLLDNRHLIDEHRFWVNTTNPEDIAYMESLQRDYPDFFTLERLADDRPDIQGVRRITLIRHFFRNCCDPGAVYIRLDDDICYIHPQAIERLLEFRLAHPEFFLVYPAIINSGRTAYIHQVMGINPERLESKIWPGHRYQEFNLIQCEPQVGEMLHDEFLRCIAQNRIDSLFFGKYILHRCEKVPINCISWLGEDFAAFGGVVGNEETRWQEELWLTQYKPKLIQRPNCIWGQSLMAHFAFHTQRDYLENETHLLMKYRLVSQYRHQLEALPLI